MRDCHLVARTCDNEVGVAISIRDPYTSPFTSRCKFAHCLLLVRCLRSETVAIGFLISVEHNSKYCNPRRACARVTVLVLSVCLSVCVCVCFPYSGTSRNQAYKQQYQRLQRDTGMKYKKGFFFKTLRSEVMASFTHLK